MKEYGPERGGLFDLSKRERTISLLIIGISVIGWCFPYWYPSFKSDPSFSVQPSPDVQTAYVDWISRSERKQDSILALRAKWKQQRDSMFAPRKRKKYPPRNKQQRPPRSEYAFNRIEVDLSIPLPTLGSVDPNTVDSVTLKRIGLQRHIMLRWLKFRDKGGTFVKRNDIAKLYDLADSTFRRIAPYFVDGEELRRGFDRNRDIVDKAPSKRPKTTFVSVEVNGATEQELIQVRGIGKFYAKQIITYRDRLGGFLTVDQIALTPRLQDSVFQKVRSFLSVDSTDIRRIAINHVGVAELELHPLISRNKARTIIDYRTNRGPFKTREDLLNTVVLSKELVDRLLPYISFD